MVKQIFVRETFLLTFLKMILLGSRLFVQTQMITSPFGAEFVVPVTVSRAFHAGGCIRQSVTTDFSPIFIITHHHQ